jgi:uncharacterized protein YqcC (DUF446 family)
MPDKAIVKERIDEIEAEMKRINMWRDKPLPPEAYNFHRAFAMDTMPFAHWLQFIFIPRVNQVITSDEPFPQRSMVGAQAVREFDCDDEASGLVSMLSSFDRVIEQG